MYSLNDRCDIYITLGDKEFDFSRNQFNRLDIIESVIQSLPILEFSYVNDGSLLDEEPLYDGMNISVAIVPKNIRVKNSDFMEFRLSSCQTIPAGEGYATKLVAYFNVPELLKSKIESHEGTSSEVFHMMANRLGLEYKGKVTKDRQVWLRPGIRGTSWLNNVCNHAWSSENSAFTWCVTRSKKLILKDLSSPPPDTPDFILTEDESFLSNKENSDIGNNVSIIFDPIPKIHSGTMNFLYGYGRDLSGHEIVSGDHKSFKSIRFKKSTASVNINKNMQGIQKSDSIGLDCGNVHPNFYTAEYQNLRFKSLYSTVIQCMVQDHQNISIFDNVDLKLRVNSDYRPAKSYAGRYIVSGVTTTITTRDYSRKLTIVREGHNTNPSGDLL